MLIIILLSYNALVIILEFINFIIPDIKFIGAMKFTIARTTQTFKTNNTTAANIPKSSLNYFSTGKLNTPSNIIVATIKINLTIKNTAIKPIPVNT